MLKDLTQGDFQYLTEYNRDMLACHEKEFVRQINPSLMRCMYRGKTKYEEYEREQYGEIQDDDAHLTALITIFQSENTIATTLYPHNPTPIIRPGRGSDADSAALMTAIIKHYMKMNRAKQQNQEAILNSRFFGLGWKKLTWRAVYASLVEEPETTGAGKQGLMAKVMDMAKGFLGGGSQMKPDYLESKERPDFADYETLINDSESPMNIALDHKADLLNTKVILHSLPRTLHDLENSGDYEDEEGTKQLEELFEHMRNKGGSRFDSRKTELHLRESHFQQRNGIWVLRYVDEWNKPLKYFQSDFQGKGFLFEPLSLTFEPGVRYPTSHVHVASQVQKKADALTSLFVELVARSVNLVVVNEEAFNKGVGPSFEKNLVRGILRHKGPIPPQSIQSFQSGSVSSDLPQLIGLLQKKISEVLGADEQLVLGKSENDTLGQDELARTGTNARTEGQRDRIKDWLIRQLEKESVLIKQYSNSELHVMVTGKDYSDPLTGEKVEDKWHSFMVAGDPDKGIKPNPLGAKHYLQGEFEHDFNMEDAKRPDKKSIREALTMVLELDSNPAVQESNLEGGFRIRRDKVVKDIMGTMDNVINPDEYIEKLDSEQMAAIQVKRLLMQSGGMLPQAKVAGKETKDSQAGEVTHPSSVEANV